MQKLSSIFITAGCLFQRDQSSAWKLNIFYSLLFLPMPLYPSPFFVHGSETEQVKLFPPL